MELLVSLIMWILGIGGCYAFFKVSVDRAAIRKTKNFIDALRRDEINKMDSDYLVEYANRRDAERLSKEREADKGSNKPE